MSRHLSGYKHRKNTQYCYSVWSNEWGFWVFFSVKVVKFIANKPQKSNFSYYRLQMCTSNQVSHESVIFALVGGGERRPGGRPFHRYVFIKGNNMHRDTLHISSVTEPHACKHWWYLHASFCTRKNMCAGNNTTSYRHCVYTTGQEGQSDPLH